MKAPISAGADFKPAPSGAHPAILIQLVDLGTQESVHNGETKQLRKLRMVFELHSDEAVTDDNKPMIVGRDFTLSSHEKANLRKFIEGWRGQAFTEEEAAEFDYEVMLDKPCILNITHDKAQNGKVYANINSAMKLMKGMTPPERVNPLVYFYMGTEESQYAEYRPDVFNAFPQWLKDKIWKSPEYKALSGISDPAPAPVAKPVNEGEPFDDEIPF